MELHFRPDDLETAFRYKSDREMNLTRIIFTLIRFPFIVTMLSMLALVILRLRLPFRSVIKNTVFKVFCAGEDLTEAMQLIEKLEKYQVFSVLDYVAEGEKSKKAYDHNASMIMANIQRLKTLHKGHSISLKLSGLEDVDFIEHRIQMKEQSPETEARYSEFIKRVDDICLLAAVNDIVVYIDAETYATQAAFDEVAELMMTRYNREELLIYNTLQMYLKDRETYLQELIAKADGKYRLGIKLVRGAYHEKEIKLAFAKGIPIPVFQSKSDTDESFNRIVQTCLERDDLITTCLATHNEDSIIKAIQYMNAKKLDRKSVRFSQLYGMSDHLTFNLAFAGCSSSKYIPYGPVDKAVPYLIRRATENTSVGGEAGRELTLLNNEIKRRNRNDKAHK